MDMVKKVLEEGGDIYTENSVLVESSDKEETRSLIVTT
ncbi:putative membrane domain protein [Anaplasma phagocytophilum str. ApMUC09]|uniref:Putative membrane domain protein n=1 Tax=Anaplasma phagocytophilum str. ApMUC09 TaxID=1359152 RepID=A0A0F3N8F7_ANAPH|nr:putative membrane domain protein [Anaplasma phagocytophilum str. ApMUC09]